MGGHSQPVRAVAADVLLAVENGQSLSQCLPPALARLPINERPVLQALCYGTCRWFHRLDGELRGRLKKPLRSPDRIVHHLMLVALFQLRFSQHATYAILNETVEASRALDKPHLTGLVNGVLRAAERDGAPAPANDADRFSHPAWMVEKLRHNWPDDWQRILDANNAQAPMTLRVNALRFTRERYLALLAEAGIQAAPTRYAPCGIQLDQPVPVEHLPWFADGAVSVQDEAAQLCTTLLDLAPGQRVLDACAAPGGKTCAILEACGDLAEVVAIDESAARLPRVQENLDRLDLEATLIQADAADIDQWWDGNAFDRILLDVPCSASGVIRRHPDIKLLRRETDIVPLAGIQLGLLEAMWSILKPGGRLVYATCSVFPQENHRIIQRFRKQQDTAVLVEPEVSWGRDMGAGRQLLPDPNSHDGFFYAVLEKPEA
ncbi:16S rRNA (cytosine(967)-C(5))-methyltransferase RsmB [Marinobacter sp. F4218]|uniref:16S rRNA (cytosine(967)-C(5))-methyltransferase RsmB n=1 Tax=Marinobacter sp. F4218 TaxID=2862868 RepID=UPI001C6271DB|nr:16S rRNA (cytosine(967)-C(5))-methyltransferase RsmB [Marinobacter sp. F4218]MBW7471778.1 16S rRNA (cytosine(967)-C(5))-methyltransferase RsmB [Marinobacter sp. F4218]